MTVTEINKQSQIVMKITRPSQTKTLVVPVDAILQMTGLTHLNRRPPDPRTKWRNCS